MIAIIADDLSGATELAGISWRYGLTVEICVGEICNIDADVLILCTDSRSRKLEEALCVTEKAIDSVLRLNPSLIYKKIDSALRGHIVEEIKLQVDLMKADNALIIPANPSIGRVLKGYEYLIKEIPVAETSFAQDPEFPVKEANIMKHFKNAITIKKSNESLANGEIIFGEVQTSSDLENWAGRSFKKTVLAGAGDFYTALLEKKFRQTNQQVINVQFPHLYVSGTTFVKTREWVKNVSELYGTVAWATPQMLHDDGNIENWIKEKGELLVKKSKLILSFEDVKENVNALQIRRLMARLAEQFITRFGVSELFIEGGSTAGAVLERMQIRNLWVVSEWQRGVVQVVNGDLFITIKPGSYDLPDAIKELYGL